MKVEFYCLKTWHKDHFYQVALIPSPFLCYNPQGYFIEQGVHSGLFVISINFLIWDFGIRIYKKFTYGKETS